MPELDQMTRAFQDLQGVYCALAMHFHPDWRAIRGECPAKFTSTSRGPTQPKRPLQDSGGPAIIRLWDAYLTLQDSEFLTMAASAAPPDPTSETVKPAPIDLADRRLPMADECMFCGSRPTLDLCFRSLSSRWLDAETQTTRGPMCGSCSLAVGRRRQRVTRQHGWAGLTVAATTMAYLRQNRRDLGRATRLGAPSFRDASVIALLRAPIGATAPLQSPAALIESRKFTRCG